MAKSLAVLLKVAAYKVEQAQNALADAERVLSQAKNDMLRWQDDAANGLAMAARAEDAVMLLASGAFRDRARDEEIRAAERVVVAEALVEKVRSELAAQYAEQQRYEILLEREKIAAKKAAAKKAESAMEDVFSSRRS